MDDISSCCSCVASRRNSTAWKASPLPAPGRLARPIQFELSRAARPRATLKELFTPISSGPININTASANVLQLVRH